MLTATGYRNQLIYKISGNTYCNNMIGYIQVNTGNLIIDFSGSLFYG